MAPIAFLMAAIAKVRDDATYWVQLGVFTVAAAVALVYGAAAVLRKAWARPGLVALSWLGALLFIGPGIVMLGVSVLSRSWEFAAVGAGVTCFGVLFAGMALQLRQLRAPLATNDA